MLRAIKVTSISARNSSSIILPLETAQSFLMAFADQIVLSLEAVVGYLGYELATHLLVYLLTIALHTDVLSLARRTGH